MAQAQLEKPDPRYALKSVTHNQAGRTLTVEWADGHASRFPLIWLRHTLFFPAVGRSEQSSDDPCLVPELPDASVIGSVHTDDDLITIHWSHDESTTQHNPVWLRDNCISQEARRDRQPKPKLWEGVDAENFEWFDAEGLDDPVVRFKLFQQVRDYGLALVRNVPVEPGTAMEIAQHFGPVRRTHHGSLFSIRSLPGDRLGAGQNIGATASNSQAPHTDEGFRHATLGIMLFHCLKPDPSGGGASLFTDGIAAAEALRQTDPEAFDFLTATPLIFAAERNPLERYRTRARAIATDGQGVVRGIRFADRTLPPMDLAEGDIERAYRALRAFSHALYTENRHFARVLEPGEMAVFDNQRVLHARRAFDPDAGERHIQQVSIERDEFHSKFRQLAEQVGRFDLANWEPDAGALSCA
ncbi:MAG: TauD/TfdA family dioxygenase [Hyphomicrobiaceae bacterium]